MSERITALGVKNVAHMAGYGPWLPGWFDRLAAQVDADEKRLAEVERENESLRERNERLDRLSSIIAGHRDDLRKANATLEADAEEWRALQQLKKCSVVLHDDAGWSTKSCAWAFVKDHGYVFAPTPTALLAKLDALAPEAPDD